MGCGAAVRGVGGGWVALVRSDRPHLAGVLAEVADAAPGAGQRPGRHPRDLAELAEGCRFTDCAHSAEPGCAVQEAVARGEVKPWRVALLQRLLGESEVRARAWSR